MTAIKYSMSFTTGALFFHESIKLAEFFLIIKKWDEVRNAVVAGNIIQARTINTLKRVTNEIISRLKTLNEHELKFLLSATYAEQGYMLWLAVCRRYTFIADFAVEIVHHNFMSFKTTVSYEDYDVFFNKKAEWHGEVDSIAPSTKRKLRQTLFKIMQEASLLDKNNTIIPIMAGAEFRTIITSAEGRETMFFPISDLMRRAE